MSAATVLRAIKLAEYGGLSILAQTDYANNLPDFQKAKTAVFPSKKPKFYQMPPCRCGHLLSDITECKCNDGVIKIYQDRLRKTYFTEEYDMYLKVDEFNEDELKSVKLLPPQGEFVALEFASDAKETAKLAKGRFGISSFDKVKYLANVIACYEGETKEIQKVHLLEALAFYFR